MKYPASQYASYLISLRELGATEQASATKKFVAFLAKNGDLKDWNRIKDTYTALEGKTSAKRQVTVKYTGSIDRSGFEKAMNGYDVNFVEDKNVKGGVELRIGDTRIDNTVRGRLAEVSKTLMQN